MLTFNFPTSRRYRLAGTTDQGYPVLGCAKGNGPCGGQSSAATQRAGMRALERASHEGEEGEAGFLHQFSTSNVSNMFGPYVGNVQASKDRGQAEQWSATKGFVTGAPMSFLLTVLKRMGCAEANGRLDPGSLTFTKCEMYNLTKRVITRMLAVNDALPEGNPLKVASEGTRERHILLAWLYELHNGLADVHHAAVRHISGESITDAAKATRDYVRQERTKDRESLHPTLPDDDRQRWMARIMEVAIALWAHADPPSGASSRCLLRYKSGSTRVQHVFTHADGDLLHAVEREVRGSIRCSPQMRGHGADMCHAMYITFEKDLPKGTHPNGVTT